MDFKLKHLAANQGNVVTRKQVLDSGISDDEISRFVREKEWITIRRGAYIQRDTWEEMSAEDQHRAKAHAVALRLRMPFAFSHISAAVLLGLPMWDVDLGTVHVTRPIGGSTRREADLWQHVCGLADEEITDTFGLPVTSAERTVIDTARTVGFESAVAIADAALHTGKTSKDELLARLNEMRDWPGARSAGRVVEFADGRAESVGETWARIVIDAVGMPRPELQVALPTGDRVDFLFREYLTVAEFDGRHKYGRLLKPGEEPGDVVWREKRREDRIRSQGYQVVRLVWADLHSPELVAARLRRAFAANGRREAA
jgi:hypothetical protein